MARSSGSMGCGWQQDGHSRASFILDCLHWYLLATAFFWVYAKLQTVKDDFQVYFHFFGGMQTVKDDLN